MQGTEDATVIAAQSAVSSELLSGAAPRAARVSRRFVAALIDATVVITCVVPICIVLRWIMEGFHREMAMRLAHATYLSGIGAVASWVIFDWIYNARAISSERQATIGKRCMRIRVTGMIGERIGFAQASARHFAKFLSTFIVLFGFMMAALSKRKQALHDIIANTLVVEDVEEPLG